MVLNGIICVVGLIHMYVDALIYHFPSVQKLTVIVQPFLGSPEEAIDLRFALLTLTSSPHVDHYLDVSKAVSQMCTSGMFWNHTFLSKSGLPCPNLNCPT